MPDSHDGELTQWTCEYGAFIPESLKPATTLQRVVITNVEAPEDPTRLWNGPDLQLAEVIEGWFDRVRTWAEILTGQDLDPSHRVFDAVISGVGLSFIEPPHEGSLGMTLTTPSIRPVRADEWRTILELVRVGTEPPLEELVSRDARAAHRRGFNRRATIDAATSLEVVLSRVLTAMADQLPEKQQKRLNDKPTLGTFVSIAEASKIEFDVPFDQLRLLTQRRNDAVHRGQAATAWETATLVQIAIDFIAAHGTFKRTGDTEPDGSEWVLGNPVDVSDEDASG